MLIYYIEFALYLALMLGIGLWSMRRTTSNKHFIIGDRQMGPITSAISAGASDMSSWLLLGLPGAVFAGGLVEGLWISLGLLAGAYINWLITAGRLRAMTERYDAVTLPSFLSKRFDDSKGILKVVSTIVILLFFTIYVSSGLKGGTLLFAHTFGASETVALVITTLVVVSYTFLGGYIAVCWTDLIQGILMLAALTFCVILGYNGIVKADVDIVAIKPDAFSIKAGVITVLSLLAWGFGYFGQPHILARFIGIKDVKSVRRARRVGISWMAICLLFASLIGLIGIGFHAATPLEGVAGVDGNAERIFLALTSALFHPIFAGVVLAAVLAAVMSTADSQLLVLTSSLTEDIPPIAALPDAKKKWISRLGVLGFALLAFLIALFDKGTILDMVGYAWGGFGAALGPVVILALFWKGCTKWGALAGMISGSVVIVVVKNWIKIEGEYFYELLPGFILAFAAVVVTSLLTKKPGKEAIEHFEAGIAEVREANRR